MPMKAEKQKEHAPLEQEGNLVDGEEFVRL